MTNHQLIQCGGHGWAPWSIVCVHLVEGTSREWVAVPSDFDEVDYDWFCPACDPENPDIEQLKAICIHCVRKLRGMYDQNYKDDDPDADDALHG